MLSCRRDEHNNQTYLKLPDSERFEIFSIWFSIMRNYSFQNILWTISNSLLIESKETFMLDHPCWVFHHWGSNFNSFIVTVRRVSIKVSILNFQARFMSMVGSLTLERMLATDWIVMTHCRKHIEVLDLINSWNYYLFTTIYFGLRHGIDFLYEWRLMCFL